MKESEEKRENSNNSHHGDTGITGVVTRRLTGGKNPHRHNPSVEELDWSA